MALNKRFARWRERYYPFLWFIAAADENKLAQCPAAEQDKQAGIGLAIVCTAIAAVLSGYFAFYSFLYSGWVAVPIAIFWGLLILNLDRIMVSSMRKDARGRLWKELIVASPRIALAVLISLLITKPIEVEFFKNQLNTRKNSVIEAALDKEMARQDSSFTTISGKRAESKQEQDKLKKTATDCAQDAGWVQADKAYNDCNTTFQQIQGDIQSRKNAKRALYGNRYYSYFDNEKERWQLNRSGLNRNRILDKEITDKQSQLNQLDCAARQRQADELCNAYRTREGAQLIKVNERAEDDEKHWRYVDSVNQHKRDSLRATMQHAYDDVFGQLRILRELKKDDKAMRQASWLIMLLFFTLEIAPILVKILSARGEYDTLLHIAEQKAFHHEDQEIELAKEQKDIKLLSASQNRDSILDKEKAANDKMIEESLEANSNLGSAIIQKWHEREIKKLNDNPDDYLNGVITVNT